MELENLMTVKEWAEREGLDPSYVRQKIRRGNLAAVKIGRDWWISKDEKNIDHRTTRTSQKRKTS